MNLGEHAHRVKFMIRDRGSNFTAAFDAILADAGFLTVRCHMATPRMNAIAERWIGDADASLSASPPGRHDFPPRPGRASCPLARFAYAGLAGALAG
jgi:hypothetical protein